MKITAQHLYDAEETIAQIIRDRRPMSQKGCYRFARMHAKLLPDYNVLRDQRNSMITAYGYHPMEQVSGPTKTDPLAEVVLRTSDAFAVPDDKIAEFNAAWKAIGEEEIEVDVQPIPLSQIDLGDSVQGSVMAHEIIVLGDLITDE